MAGGFRADDGDRWDVGKLELGAYLDRIGHGWTTPSVAALTTLHEAHVGAIPFENLDVVLGRRIRLGLDSIAGKLVDRPRGGYCYEHALLFAAALQRMGFAVQRRLARVGPEPGGPRTHMMLVVQVEGQRLLADVGYGSGLLRPLPLRVGALDPQAGWPHRLTRTDGLWELSKRDGARWTVLHRFDDTGVVPSDIEIANHYIATHPRSPFTGRPVVLRLRPGRLDALIDAESRREWADGRVERQRVGAASLGPALQQLGVTLTEAERAELVTTMGRRLDRAGG